MDWAFLSSMEVYIQQVCRSSLLSGRNVRWPRCMPPLVSHVEYSPCAARVKVGKKTGQTDGRRPDRYITLTVGCGQHNKFATVRKVDQAFHIRTLITNNVIGCSLVAWELPVFLSLYSTRNLEGRLPFLHTLAHVTPLIVHPIF